MLPPIAAVRVTPMVAERADAAPRQERPAMSEGSWKK